MSETSNQNNINKAPSHLDDALATRMLKNVFAACDVTPNAIPLEHLESRGNFINTHFGLCSFFAALMVLILLTLPIFFIPASIVGEISNGQGTRDNTYSFVIDSIIPVKRIKAYINGYYYPVTSVDDTHYTTTIDRNGDLNVDITLVNGRTATYSFPVTTVLEDTTNPLIINKSLEGNELTVFVEDASAGVDYDKVYAVDLDGNNIEVIRYDEGAGTIVFPYFHKTLNIFIPDKNGNTLQAIVSSTQRNINQ